MVEGEIRWAEVDGEIRWAEVEGEMRGELVAGARRKLPRLEDGEIHRTLLDGEIRFWGRIAE